MKAIALLCLICASQVLASDEGMFSGATRRVMNLLSLRQKHNYLVVTNDMRDSYVPGNIRAMDLAKTLRADGHDVTIVSKNGNFAPEFSSQLEAVGVEMHSVATEPHFFTESLLKSRNFDAAFLYLWFWGSDISVPQAYIPTIRAVSPATKIVVVTDDAHTERNARLNTVNSVLSRSVNLADAFARDGEMAIYESADAVMTVSEADTEILTAQLKGLNIPVVTAHWGHQLSSLAIPSAAEVAPFERRSGLVFVGYGKNPSNQIGLQWFFEKVYPLLQNKLPNERVYIVGDAPEDGYASLSKSGARIIPMSQRDDASMRTILSSARVMIAPIFSTGLTTKVLLGLSNGLPVVSTRMAAAGYKWAGSEAEFEAAMLVASNAQQFADAIVSVATNAAEWSKYSTGGLKLATTQSSPARFSADVLALVATLKLKAGTSSQSAIPFVAPSALRAMEQKLKAQNPFELMAGTGGSSSGMDDPCGADKIQPLTGGLFTMCKCSGQDCITEAIVCTPSDACRTAGQALLDCRAAPAFQIKTIQDTVKAYDALKAKCDAKPGTASTVSSMGALVAAGVAAAVLAL